MTNRNNEDYRKMRVGEINTMNDGRIAMIIEYRTTRDIDVLFTENNEIVKNVQYGHFKRGSVTVNKTTNRIGEIHKLNCGWNAEIINYNESKDVSVRILETGEIVNNIRYVHLLDSSLVPKTFPTVYGIGFLGTNDVDYKGSYKSWNRMMERCYSEKVHSKYPSYKNCTVCEEWHNYSNYKKWYDRNYYEVGNCRMNLDKDILVKGNKIYSPNTCVFTPNIINIIFTKRDSKRGVLPLGVRKCGKKYQSYLSAKGSVDKPIYLGTFKTPEEAFLSYKIAKEQYIQQMADEYKDHIPQKLYDAMYRYEVEITD